MEYRRLGKTGLKVSALSYGAWVTFGQQIDDETAKALIKTAYDGGVTFFDNAEVYAAGQAERVMGKALADLGFARDSFCVSSKVYWGPTTSNTHPTTRGLSRKHVTEVCHAALKRLRVDYLDLYFCHRPDRETPIAETVAAMTDLIRQGKVLYWGTSEWTARDIALAHAAAREYGLYAPVVEQPQYNLFHRARVEVEYSRLYEDPGLGTTVWSPLASGLLSGKYLEGDPGDTRISMQGMEWLKERFEGEEFEQKCKIVAELGNLAGELGTTLPRLGLAWCLKNPNVSTAIMGASKVYQLEENLKAMNDVALLTDEVMARIDAVAGTRPEPEPLF
ncbi:aldo/keto reductase [Ruficoccus amylovorans]|uniref:Aldo/keto reductase n=1 Tax=Ruficoccus amylovorans TaxID=1804625 RepID=A0A842HFA9_9BACT|nr:aldo/keto reductase [Ruficoccus amylovorans]MBC2595213.1 aldo/keto reductase [Ruficoccus amylovorans]